MKKVSRLLPVVILGFSSVAVPPVAQAQTYNVDLTVENGDAVGWSVDDVKPGTSGSWSIEVCNRGELGGTVYIWISDIVSFEGLNPESETGDTAEPGELLPYMFFDVSTVPAGGLGSDLSLPNTIDNYPQGVSFDSGYLRLTNLSPGECVTLNWQWAFLETGGPQNEAQGDGISFTINFTLISPEPTPPSRGVVETEPVCFFDVDMLGEVTRIWVTCDDGRCLANYEPEDPDEVHFLDFIRGTRTTYMRADRFNGGPPRWIRMRVSDDPPPIPAGMEAVSDVYTFIGYTATGKEVSIVMFDREVGMELDYDPDNLPDDTVSVGIAGWDPDEEEWVVHPEATGRVAGIGTATADVTHFSTFVVLATTGEPEEEVDELVSVIPAGTMEARFKADGLMIEPSTERFWVPLSFVTRTGKGAVITATILNAGEEAGTYTAELLLNGEVVGAQDVELTAGEQKQVRFHLNNVARGTHTVTLAGLSGMFASSQSVNWLLIAAVCALIAALILVLALRRRRSHVQDKAAEA